MRKKEERTSAAFRIAPQLLDIDKFIELVIRKVLHSIFLSEEVLDCQTDDSIKLLSAPDLVLQSLFIVFTDKILLEFPS